MGVFDRFKQDIKKPGGVVKNIKPKSTPKPTPKPASKPAPKKQSKPKSVKQKIQEVREDPKQYAQGLIEKKAIESNTAGGSDPDRKIIDETPRGQVTKVDAKQIPDSTMNLLVKTTQSSPATVNLLRQRQTVIERPVDIKPTPYKKEWGFQPDDPDYYTIQQDIKSNKEQLDKNSQQIFIDYLRVKQAPEDSTFDIPGKEGATKQETLAYITPIMFDEGRKKQTISDYEQTVKAFKEGGYYVDVTKDGSITFKQPTAKEVHQWKYGETASTGQFVARQAQGLGIGTALTGINQLALDTSYAINPMLGAVVQTISGSSRDVWKNYEEAEYRRLLDISQKPDEDFWQYSGRYWTSSEAIESVYIPIATFGAGYVYQGIRAGATGISTVSKTGLLYRAGARIGSSGVVSSFTKASPLIRGTVKATPIVVGGALMTPAVINISQQPADLRPGATGRLISSMLLGGAGFKLGQMTYTATHTIPSPPIDPTKTSLDIRTYSKRDIIGRPIEGKPDYMRFKSSDADIFGQTSPQGTIKGTTRLDATTYTQGDIARSSGTLAVKQTWRSRIGTRFSNMKIIDVDSTALKFSGYEGQDLVLEFSRFTNRATGERIFGAGGSLIEKADDALIGISKDYYPKLTTKPVVIKSGVTSVKLPYTKPQLNPFSKASKPITKIDFVPMDTYKTVSVSNFYTKDGLIGRGLDYSNIFMKSGTGSGSASGISSSVSKGGTSFGYGGSGTSQAISSFVTPVSSVSTTSVSSIAPAVSLSGSTASASSSAVISSSVAMASGGITIFSPPVNINKVKSSYRNTPIVLQEIKPISIQSPITSQTFSLQTDTIQTPIYDTGFETIQSPMVSQNFETIQTPVLDFSFETVQTPIKAQMTKTSLLTETIQTPVTTSMFSFPATTPIVPKYPFPWRFRRGGGRTGGEVYPMPRWAGRGYRFRTWDVPTLESLLTGSKKKYKNKYFKGW